MVPQLRGEEAVQMKYYTLNFIKIGSKQDRVFAGTLMSYWACAKEVGAKSERSMNKTRCSQQKIQKKLFIYHGDGIKLFR